MRAESKIIMDLDTPSDYALFISMDGEEAREIISALHYIKNHNCTSESSSSYVPNDETLHHILETLEHVDNIH